MYIFQFKKKKKEERKEAQKLALKAKLNSHAIQKLD